MKLVDGNRTGIKVDTVLMTVNEDQKILKKILNDLLGAEGDMLPGHQIHTGGLLMGVYIIEMPEGGLCLFDNRGKAGLFLGVQGQDLPLKRAHNGTVAQETQHDHIGGFLTAGAQIVKFVGAVEGGLTAF